MLAVIHLIVKSRQERKKITFTSQELADSLPFKKLNFSTAVFLRSWNFQ